MQLSGVRLSFEPPVALWGKQHRVCFPVAEIEALSCYTIVLELHSWWVSKLDWMPSTPCSQDSGSRCLAMWDSGGGCGGPHVTTPRCPADPYNHPIGVEFYSLHLAGGEPRLREGRRESSITQLVGWRPGLSDSKTQCFPPPPASLAGHKHWLRWLAKYALERHLESGGSQISYSKGLRTSPEKRDVFC